MGSHRADRRGPIRRPSRTSSDSKYVGRRVAGREPVPTPIEINPLIAAPAVDRPVITTTPGKRKAVKHAAPRGPLFKGMPSQPVLLGVATLAVAVTGTVASAGTDLDHSPAPKFNAASALSGDSGVGTVNLEGRNPPVSRDSSRQALDDASDARLKDETEQVAEQRNAALGQLAQLAERQADKIAENRWVLPLDSYGITATYGEYGLWSSYHTGLDFNGDEGDPIKSVANGIVTSTGSDGAYGNKTVVTLEDGTEIWYCHQSSIHVSVGDTVTAGEVIGAVGSTGHVTGSHLHLEVRPGGGDPVDPYAAFVVHGVTP